MRRPVALRATLALFAMIATSTVAFAAEERRRSVAEPSASALGASLAALFPRTEDHDFEAPRPGTYSLPVIKAAGDGDVLDHYGRALRLKSVLAGKISLLSFIYVNCGDERGCPLATGRLYDIFHASAEASILAAHVQLVTLSFDPARDTPEAMASYGFAALEDARRNNKMAWSFLTTRSAEALGPILKAYGQTISAKADGETLNHLLRLYLIDHKGRIRNVYGLGFLDPRLLLADIETLLIEEGLVKGGS